MDNTLSLKITRSFKCEVLVIGGGVAGISAAVCAAREGADVMLCEQGGCLGGTASQGLVGPFMSSFDPTGDHQVIKGFMDETGYRFGRFDFIRKDGELWFLELNPNGQWAWLDEKNEHGLVSMVADAIKAEDQAHRENPSRR